MKAYHGKTIDYGYKYKYIQYQKPIKTNICYSSSGRRIKYTGVFEYGQLYTMFSRVRSAEDIILTQKLNPEDIKPELFMSI